MAQTFQGMTFGQFVMENLRKYHVPEEEIISGLSYAMRGHGYYSGGETMGPKTKEELDEYYKERYEQELREFIAEVKDEPKKWDIYMNYAVGMLILYEWEQVRNNIPMDTSLRPYLKELCRHRPSKTV